MTMEQIRLINIKDKKPTGGYVTGEIKVSNIYSLETDTFRLICFLEFFDNLKIDQINKTPDYSLEIHYTKKHGYVIKSQSEMNKYSIKEDTSCFNIKCLNENDQNFEVIINVELYLKK